MTLDEMDFGTYPETDEVGRLISRHWKYGWKDPKNGYMKFSMEVYETPVSCPQGSEIRKFEKTDGAPLVMLQIGLEYEQKEPGGEWEPVDLKKMAPRTWVEEYRRGEKTVNYSSFFWTDLRPMAYEGFTDKLGFKKPWTSRDQQEKERVEKAQLEENLNTAKDHMTQQEAELRELRAKVRSLEAPRA